MHGSEFRAAIARPVNVGRWVSLGQLSIINTTLIDFMCSTFNGIFYFSLIIDRKVNSPDGPTESGLNTRLEQTV